MVIQTERFSIRPIQSAERDAVLAVYQQCEDFLALGPDPHASYEMIDRDMQLSRETGGSFCGIYFPGEQMIGVLDVIPRGFEGNPAAAFIELLMIAVPFRGQGLGADIAAAVEAEIARDPAVREIRLGAQVNNPGALRFWPRMGYVVIGGPERMADGTTVYHLRKELAPPENR